MDWFKRHQTVTGIIIWLIAQATAWAAGGCAPAFDQDILARLHLTCANVVWAMNLASAFLVGAGIRTSDRHAAVIQGIIPPAGPPAEIPPAEAKRLGGA